MTSDPKCPNCGNQTIQFRGRGQDLEYMICPRYREPGHLSDAEVKERFLLEKNRHAPSSGRYP
jgi:hypothetical protein